MHRLGLLFAGVLTLTTKATYANDWIRGSERDLITGNTTVWISKVADHATGIQPYYDDPRLVVRCDPDLVDNSLEAYGMPSPSPLEVY